MFCSSCVHMHRGGWRVVALKCLARICSPISQKCPRLNKDCVLQVATYQCKLRPPNAQSQIGGGASASVPQIEGVPICPGGRERGNFAFCPKKNFLHKRLRRSRQTFDDLIPEPTRHQIPATFTACNKIFFSFFAVARARSGKIFWNGRISVAVPRRFVP